MGKWFELDFTSMESYRVKVAAAKDGVTPEEWMSRIIRSSVGLSERLGARFPGPGVKTIDIREEN